MKLDKKELGMLSTLSKLSERKFSNKKLNDPALRERLTSKIKSFIIASALGLNSKADDYNAKVEEALSSSTIENAFATGMSVALVCGYFQSLDNDIATSETPDFGFAGLSEAFRDGVATALSEFVKPEDAGTALSIGLHVTIRSCKPEEYFGGDLCNKDLAYLGKLLASDVDDGYNKKLLEALRRNTDVSGAIKRYTPDIQSVYDLLFADSFGIEQYKGVLFDGGKFITIEEGANIASPVKEGPETLTEFANRIYKKISGNIVIAHERQFDYAKIFSTSEIVYFPYKILEYALGRESTLNMSKPTYKNSAYSISWESYSKQYVFKNIDDILYRGAYKALEKVLRDGKALKDDFTSQAFMMSVKDYDAFLSERLGKADVMPKIRKLLGKLVRSIKCAYILSKYPCLAGNIAAINFRVCMEPGSGDFSADVSTARSLFYNLVAENKNEQFIPPVDISGGRKSGIGVDLSTCIYEYQYDINPLLTKAEPLFGYTVQRLNQKKGRSAGWDNILIGQSLSGKELYASATSDIPMQKAFTHNIIAGSRSGKGVMTMNILANALAANKPIFYLDRKPDMASMLYDLSGGKQFIVNGGLYQAEFDNCNCFAENSGAALEMWRSVAKPYLDANPEIAELFGSPGQGYYGVLGDYIYFRAFMFCLGLCVLRTKLSGCKDELRDKTFGGNNGIVIVVDELTGFQSSISRIFSTISSKLVQAALKIGDADAIIANRERLLDDLGIWEKKADEATKESARMQAESKARATQRDLDALIDKQGIYAATLFQKIRDSYSALIDNKVAGFVNKEFDYSDIFVLGQFLTAGYFATSLTSTNPGSLSSVFFPLTSTKKDYYASYKGADIIRSFIEELGQEDWFLGRNPGYDYAKKSKDPAALQCLDVDGNWEYVGLHTCNEIRLVDDASFARPVLFKPYLVLNTSLEANPPLSGKGDYQYVQQCAKRVNDTAGGIDLWETVRLKHLPQDVRSKVTATEKMYGQLDEGIGFKGLVFDTLSTTKEGKGLDSKDIDAYIVSVLSKSGEIANFVAEKMGYSCWQALIFDLSPKGLFGFNDMVNAVMEDGSYTMESRLPLYAKLGLLSDSGDSSDDAETPGEQSAGGSFDDLFSSLGDDLEEGEGAGGGGTPPINAGDPGDGSTSVDPGASSFSSAEEELWGSWDTQTTGDPVEQTEKKVPDPFDTSTSGESDTSVPDPGTRQDASSTSFDISSVIHNLAAVAVNLAIGMDRSGYVYSADERNELENLAYKMLKQYMMKEAV